MNSNDSAADGMQGRAILVLGPHRSGTSLVTHCLQGLGAHLGERLLDANIDNPKGFFENARVVEFNDRALKRLGLCWDYFGPMPDHPPLSEDDPLVDEAFALLGEEFGTRPLIALKDPRLCLLADIWRSALLRYGYAVDHVLVLRSPSECAKSQCTRFRRDPQFHFVGGDLTEGVLLWARYMHEALHYLQDRPFVLAAHQSFVDQPERACLDLAHALGIPGSAAHPASNLLANFADPALRRSTLSDDEIAALPALVLELEANCRQLSAHHASVRFDAVREATLANLSRALESQELLHRLGRCYARTRHAAVEANLELAEAKRIVAYQESALASEKRQRAELEERQAREHRQLLSMHRELERLRLIGAARDDKD